jgi:hypothetical protein
LFRAIADRFRAFREQVRFCLGQIDDGDDFLVELGDIITRLAP